MKVPMKKYLLLLVLFLCYSANLYSQNRAFGWGNDNQGQLGILFEKWIEEQSGSASDWKFVSCGNSFVIAIKNDDTMWGWVLIGQVNLATEPESIK